MQFLFQRHSYAPPNPVTWRILNSISSSSQWIKRPFGWLDSKICYSRQRPTDEWFNCHFSALESLTQRKPVASPCCHAKSCLADCKHQATKSECKALTSEERNLNPSANRQKEEEKKRYKNNGVIVRNLPFSHCCTISRMNLLQMVSLSLSPLLKSRSAFNTKKKK